MPNKQRPERTLNSLKAIARKRDLASKNPNFESYLNKEVRNMSRNPSYSEMEDAVKRAKTKSQTEVMNKTLTVK